MHAEALGKIRRINEIFPLAPQATNNIGADIITFAV
jgi:hypothetical protein